VSALLFELGLAAPVEPVDDLLDELLVVGHGVEVSASADYQRLPDLRLEAMMSLLCDTVLMGTAGMDPRRAKPVVGKQRREALGERPASAALQLMGRGREVVAASHFG
jgi:hypothetical protein